MESRRKRLGQSFLINESIAQSEAVHGEGKNVLELGAGHGILTRELCKVAKRVVSVEIDPMLYDEIKRRIKAGNLKLINKDFFKATKEELELGKIDIMIANIPYSLSSKTIGFLSDNSLQAVLCLQKEFIEHMLAKPGTRKYSRLSVMSQLSFSMTKIMNVSRGNFDPSPKVDSGIIYLKPKQKIGKEETDLINRIMQHKKKSVKNAIKDALKKGMKEEAIDRIVEEAKKKGYYQQKVFKLTPEEILDLAKIIEKETAPGSG